MHGTELADVEVETMKHLDAPAAPAPLPQPSPQLTPPAQTAPQEMPAGQTEPRAALAAHTALQATRESQTTREPLGEQRPIDQPGWFDKLEAFVSRLSVRDNFWNSICSLIWLPLAFFSGIRMKELDENSFVAQAILPFRRFNRNWYRAMAGGALLANSEIAGGGYVFGICGAEYTVVCKNLNYTFLRPCFGPAVYRMTSRDDIRALAVDKREFNCVIDMEILQQGIKGQRDRRVGRCEATFHATPKVHHRKKALLRKPQ